MDVAASRYPAKRSIATWEISSIIAVPLSMHKMKNSVIYLRDLKND
jgi:hypothetical protein